MQMSISVQKVEKSDANNVGIVFATASGSGTEPEVLYKVNERIHTNYIQRTENDLSEADTVIEIPEEVWMSNNEENNHAIVDTGCAKSVAGKKWAAKLIVNMDQDDLNDVRTLNGHEKFRFGSGQTFTNNCL